MEEEKTEQVSDIIEETVPQQEEPQQEQVTEKKESAQSSRFKVLREARERAERERDELKARIEQLEIQHQQPQKDTSYEEDFSIGPDDLVEGKHLSRYEKQIQTMKKELDTYKQQTTSSMVETRLRTEFPDFDTVVNRENIEILTAQNPHLAATINASSDLYSKAAAAYTMIKTLGIHNEQEFVEDKIKAHENLSKPRTVSSISKNSPDDSPLSQANAFANRMSDEEKRERYERMKKLTG